MLGLGAATRIFVATGATDMRLGFNGLYALAVGQLKQDPQSGHLFLFANQRRDRMKILFFDGSSLWVCARRMEQGRLHWPRSGEGRVQLTREEFALLIGASIYRSYSDTAPQVVPERVGRGITRVPEGCMNTGDLRTNPQRELLSKKHRGCAATTCSAGLGS